MDENIQKILSDLYELDPKLKNDEAKLVGIVKSLMALKPEPELDAEFVRKLRVQLLASAPKESGKQNFGILNYINETFMQKFNYALGAVVVCLLLVAGAVFLTNQPGTGNKKLSFDNKLKITSTSDNAFGRLASVSQVNNTASGMGGDSASAPEMASNSAMTTLANPRSESGGGSGVTDKMIAPGEPYPGEPYPYYRYVYKGEELDLSEAKRMVLKRLKGSDIASDLGGLLNAVSFGLIDFNTFSNLRLQSANFVQQGGDNYNFYVNMDESSISINGGWPMPYAMDTKSSMICAPEFCNPQPPIQIGDIPGDAELIAISERFLADHNISVGAYGQPVVLDDWRRWYAQAEDKSMHYLPDTVTVVYPVMIEGQTTYDEGGNETGLNVSVSVRNKKVTGVWDLSVQNYQSSMYDSETDSSRIMKIVERGGMWGYLPPEATNFIDIEVGTPSVEYVKMWNYNNASMRSEELLIPSLVFPVMTNPNNEMYFRKSVVVPLIKEILDQNNYGGPIMPMERSTPASEPAVGM